MSLKKLKELDKLETNSTVHDRLMRRKLRCSLCPPNKVENAKRQSKHGHRKPKYKDKR